MQTIFIESPETYKYVEPGLDQTEYRMFLEQARLRARIEPGQDDSNIAIAEKLVDTGMTDEQALQLVIPAFS